MRNLRRFFAFALAVTLLVCPLPVAAAAEDTAEYSGFMFKLAEDAVVLMAEDGTADGVAQVAQELGLYQAETVAEIAAFAPLGAVEYIVPDYKMERLGAPNDPYYQNGTQWQMDGVDMDFAWDRGVDGTGVRVGILDSGIKADHEDLVDINLNRELSANFYVPQPTEAERTNLDDTSGHGSACAGVIAATADNGKGIAGIAPGAEIVILKCFEGRSGYMSGTIRAIMGGIKAECDVLSMSLGLYAERVEGGLATIKPLQTAVEAAAAAGVIMVAAAGNDGDKKLCYPAAYPEVIGVGSVDKNGKKAWSSQYNDSVFLTAPGASVYSVGIGSSQDYHYWSGTSFSTPCVTAAVALVLQRVPDMDLDRLRAVLAKSATDLGKEGWDVEFGHGRLNVSALLETPEPPRVLTTAGNGGVTVAARYYQMAAGQEVTAMAAVYDLTGRMIDWDQGRATADGNGILDTQLAVDMTAPGSRIEVFLWDQGTWTPVAGRISVPSSQ